MIQQYQCMVVVAIMSLPTLKRFFVIELVMQP